jgi:hypothetical protein
VTTTSPFAKRLPHIITRHHLATILAATYAEALAVDEEEAHERLTRALEDPEVQDDIYWALEEGLAGELGTRTDPDALLDKLSKGVEKRARLVKAAPQTPPVAAVMVLVNLAIRLAPESMRTALQSDKGRAVADEGLRIIGRHIVKELLK